MSLPAHASERLLARDNALEGLEVIIAAGSGSINLSGLLGGGAADSNAGSDSGGSDSGGNGNDGSESGGNGNGGGPGALPTAQDPGSTAEDDDAAEKSASSTDSAPENTDAEEKEGTATSGTFSQEPDDKVYTCQSEYVDFSESDAMSKFSFVWCPENAYQTQNSVVWRLTQECGTTMVYPKDFHYGRIEARIRIGGGSGVVTALLLIGPPPSDEIDFEWVGKDLTHVQTMYYVQAHRVDPLPEVFGVSQGSNKDLSTSFQDYAIELREDSVKWFLNGNLLRTLKKGSREFPSDATRAKMGIWDGTQTSGWAGAVDWGGGPFTAEM
ncbi:putative glycosidase CRH2, partial [Coemansia sp. RSA 552]